MKRASMRFNKRVKVRTDMDERVIYLEKLNDILLRNSQLQMRINLELRGKHDSVQAKFLKIYQQLREITDDDGNVAEEWHEKVDSVVRDFDNLAAKVDVMEELLEEIA